MKMKRIILSLMIVLVATAVIGCGVGAKEGDTVSVHYTGTLENGTVFDSSYDRGVPLEFVIGAGQMIPGFDEAVRGMKAGQVKTVNIPPADAYGEYQWGLVSLTKREDIPPGLEFQVGQQWPLVTREGKTVIGTVTEVTDESVTIDANHELAGKTLTFEIELLEIIPAQ